MRLIGVFSGLVRLERALHEIGSGRHIFAGPACALLLLPALMICLPTTVWGQAEESSARLPPHRLTVTVLDGVEGRPVAGASFLGAYLDGRESAGGRPVTDERGVATLSFSFPANASTLSRLQVSVVHSNYGSRNLTWTAPPDRLLSMLPTNYTVRFSATETIGGFVRDEAGRPVADARLELWGGADRSGEPNTEQTNDSSAYYSQTMGGLRTDVNGFWTASRVPADLAEVGIVVTRPGGAVNSFSSAAGTNEALVEMVALRRTNAVLTLPEGVTVRGIVVDEDGQAFPGVRLREGNGRMPPRNMITNGPDGRFELPHRSGSQVQISVDFPRHAYVSTNIALDRSMPELRLVLPKPPPTRRHLLTMTVLDEAEGRPVAGAGFSGSYLNSDLNSDDGDGGRPVTDARGVATLSFNFPREVSNSMSRLQLSVIHSNQARRTITWTAPPSKFFGAFPTNYTVRLAATATIGGFVRNEAGGPVAGARLELWGGNTQSYEPDAVRTTEASEYYSRATSGTITDTNGFWSAPQVPVDLASLGIVVIRPGGGASSFNAGRSDPGSVDMAALRRTNAVLSVPEGFTVRGLVLDEIGQPVPGVRLRERSGQSGRMHVFTNEADGRFALPHRTGGQMQISVDSPRHALVSTNILEPSTAELRLVLPRQRPARLRMVDGEGRPVYQVHVQTLEWRNAGRTYEWSGMTDREGRITWSNAPVDRVILMFSGGGFPPRRLRLTPGDAEVVVRMARETPDSTVLRLKLVDEGAGRPVPGATVLRTSGVGRPSTELGHAGLDGVLETTIRAAKPGEREQPFYLAAHGEGYLQWVSEEQFVLGEGDVELTAALKKGRAAGVVLRPDGGPASGAKLILNRSENRVYSYRPGDFNSSDSRNDAQTATNGTFAFASAAGDHRLIAVHRSGFASLSVGELGDSGKLTLLPWGRIEGVVGSGGQPLARQQVTLRSPLNPSYVESHSFNYSTTTDRAGRFVFTNIPPGEHLLLRNLRLPRGGSSIDSHRLPVVVRPGETRQVTYEFGGRVVTGFVDAEGDIDWTRDAQVLELKLGRPPPEPIHYGMAGPGTYERLRRVHARSAAVLDYERKRQQFQLTFDRDGAFRIEDVPAGTYQLRLRAFEPRPPEAETSGRSSERAEIATLVREVVVPAGAPATEFDLGTFRVETKPTASAALGPPISFRATTLDGRPFDLARQRGRPTVVLFCANWAPGSSARLNELQAALSGHPSGTNAALISVHLDDDPGMARQSAQRFGPGWTHLYLDGPARFDVTEQLGVDTLPAAFLLGADGSVTARDPSGRRLAAVLSRANHQPSRP